MDKGLVLIGIALLVVFDFMSVNVLKTKIERLQEGMDKQKQYWKSAEYSIEIQSNQLSKEIQERGQFQEKALGQLTQTISTQNAEDSEIMERIVVVMSNEFKEVKGEIIAKYKGLSNQIIDHDENVADDNTRLRTNIKELGEKLETKINSSTEEINKCTKTEAGRIIYTPLKVKYEK